jgi:hypothetical protein
MCDIAMYNGTEHDETLPILHIFMKTRMDGSLGLKVYRKLTYTNLHLCSKTAHHPSQK